MKKVIIYMILISLLMGCRIPSIKPGGSNSEASKDNFESTAPMNTLEPQTEIPIQAQSSTPLIQTPTENSVSPTANIIPKQPEGNILLLLGPNNESCPVYLGMPMDEAKTNIKNAEIELKGNLSLYNEKYNLRFGQRFNDNGEKVWKLVEISISSPDVSTFEGLRIGDGENKIEEIYGQCENIKENPVYQSTEYTYDMGSYILWVLVGGDEDSVCEWEISGKKTDGIILLSTIEDENQQPGEFILKAEGKENLRFYLGMPHEEAVSLFEKIKMEYDDYSNTEDDTFYFNNYSSIIEYEDIQLKFKENYLCSIEITSDLYVTSEDLKIGDSEGKLLSLYPDSTSYMYTEDSKVYENNMDGYFFNIMVRPYNGKVYGWSLTSSSMVNNVNSD